MTTTESNKRCVMCKSEHEKCDINQPHSLPCQKSSIESPRYTGVKHLNALNQELRALPMPLTEFGLSQATAHQVASWTDTGDLDPKQVAFEASHSMPGTSGAASGETPSEIMDISNRSQVSAVDTMISPDCISTPPGVGKATPMTSGPVYPLGALFSLGQLLDVVPPLQCAQHTEVNVPLVANRSPPYIEGQDNVTTRDDGDSEGVVSVIRRQPVLDKTVESNALPFVLQGYARWISRLAFDPPKLTAIAREFVYNQFEDGDRSRWIIALLANIGSRIGSVEVVEGKQNPMLSALQTATRQRLEAVKSRPNTKVTELAKAFDSATEAMVVQFYASPICEAMTLREEAGSIFRQLCPGPLDAPISLFSLLQHPLDCLWRYAEIDIIFSVTADLPTLFRYDSGIPGCKPFNPYQPAAIQREGIVQWLRGMPNQLALLFAHMKMIRQDGLTPNGETIAWLERSIHELQPFNGSSSERYLAIMRSVVQECWRQAAFIYLYMAVCGDSSDTPRVREAFKRYMRLLNGTEPGRLPDEFLIFSFVLVGPAAQRLRDRKIIKQRALGLHTRDRTHIATSWIILVIDDIWARADADQRPVMWFDVSVSRKKFLNV